VLYSTDPHYRARLFAFMTTLHGGHVRAYKDFEQAVFWLSQGEVGQGWKTTRGTKIPVRFAGKAKDRPGQIEPRRKTSKATQKPAS
jgi:hypothetical protein